MTALTAVRCPRCGVLLQEVPTTWVVSVRLLSARDRASGLGAVKHCYGKACHGTTWVEIVIATLRSVA